MQLMAPPQKADALHPQECVEQAMVELLYSSGLRLSELIQLNLEHLDLSQGLVTVLGKGRKTRIVPIGQAAHEALIAWLVLRPKTLKDPQETALFIGPRGTRYSARTLQDRLAKRAQALGLAEHVHPHMLRHSCASHVLQSSSDLRGVQELLGHASIASTQIYTHLDFQSLAQAYDAAHPRARKSSSGDPS
jgi:integrase/recombinase XerC